MKKVAIATLGCKVNQYDSACIADEFEQNGYQMVSYDDHSADIYIINTCTVTNRTDFKSRSLIRKALERKKESHGVKVIVTGCYSQLKSQDIEKIGNVDLITGNDEKSSLLDLLIQVSGRQSLTKALKIKQADTLNSPSTHKLPGRARAFIKIQDGCDFYCAYCIVPFARGKPRSRTPNSIISQVKKLINSGYKEFIITGINTGLYHSNISFTQLLTMLEDIDGVEKIRISSLEPQLIGQDLISYFKNSKKLCPHFHIPLQSGSDKLLQSMNRNYNTFYFRELLSEIKKTTPHAAIGTDLIIGLPGETEEDYQTTYNYIKDMPLTYVHVFPYSIRDKTAAALMKNQVPSRITKERCKAILELAENKKKDYIRGLIESEAKLSGIIENKTDSWWTSLSDHYIRIYIKDNCYHTGDLVAGSAIKEYKDGIMIT